MSNEQGAYHTITVDLISTKSLTSRTRALEALIVVGLHTATNTGTVHTQIHIWEYQCYVMNLIS